MNSRNRALVVVVVAAAVLLQAPVTEAERPEVDLEIYHYSTEDLMGPNTAVINPDGTPGPASPMADRKIRASGVLLYDNGPLVNSAGTGVGGADESVLQNVSLAMNTLGAGHQFSAGNRIADDFVIPPGETWAIGEIEFFAYQTNSPTTSTMTGVYLQIWDGSPDNVASTVIWGDTTTNILNGTTWTNIYRVAEDTTGTASNRPIMVQTALVNTTLGEGTYWLDWMTDGTLSSGPWAPPITITGQTTTGNALQWTGAWAPLNDTGTSTQQGFPFEIYDQSGAAINLVKTVSLTADPCTTGADIIVVPPGTDVYYCYEVTNTGFDTLTTHDLVDSELGTLLSGFALSLAPAATANVTQGPITINTTTMNTATWTAYVVGGPSASDDDTATVVVSAPAPVVCNGPTIGFDAGIPPDWSVVNNAAGNPVFWTDVAGSGEAGNWATGNGDCASASSDLQGGGSGLYDTELWTPPIVLTGQVSANLNYWANYGNFASVDFLDLDISTDGGGSWTNLLSWNQDHHPNGLHTAPGEEVNLDLTAYVGQTVILRWHYYDPTGPVTSQDWYAQVDEVTLTCVVPVELQSFSID